MTVQLNIPEDIAAALAVQSEDLAQAVLQATALELYREGKSRRASYAASSAIGLVFKSMRC